jgi:hypothetical protein
MLDKGISNHKRASLKNISRHVWRGNAKPGQLKPIDGGRKWPGRQITSKRWVY